MFVTTIRLLLTLLLAMGVINYVRRPDVVRRDVCVMLLALDAFALSALLHLGKGPLGAAAAQLPTLLLLAQPALLVLLVRHFQPVPQAIGVGVVMGLVLMAAAMFGFGAHLPVAVGAAIIAYFLAVEIYVTAAFIRGARRATGVARRRMNAVATGAGMIGLLVVVALIAEVSGAAAGSTTRELEVVTLQGLLLLLAASYLLGFTPPAWLRRWWQTPSLYAFLTRSMGSPIAEDALDGLASFALQATGGRAVAVALPRADGPGLAVQWWTPGQQPPEGAVLPEPETGAMGRAWRGGEPAAAHSLEAMQPEGQQLAAAVGAHALLAVPIGDHGGVRGLLLVFTDRGWFFPDDDLALLRALAEHAAVVLRNAALLQEATAAAGRLVAANAEMERASRAKTDFLAGMSHELRTPLNAILGFSELLLDDADTIDAATRREFLQNVHTAGRHLLGLINDVLDLAKVEAGRLTLRPELVLVEMAVDQAVRGVEPLATKAGVIVTALTAGSGPVSVDPGKLQQILYNLLSNAIKFTPSGGRVTVRAQRTAEQIVVAVEDTGVGISAADQRRLFEPFEQVGDDLRGREGTGLGLALTRGFVELHGGQITVRSTPGSGSCFEFTLPLGPNVIGAPPAPEPAEAPRSRLVPAPAREEERPLVLVVEDDAATARLLTAYLTRGGYSTDVAPDGLSALHKARTLLPAAITLDIQLPGLNGWDVLRALKGDPATRDIPVVVASVLDEPHTAYGLGAVDCLVKPINGPHVVAWLDRLCGGRDGGRPEAHHQATVLVADSDDAARQAVQAALEPRAARVLGAGDGLGALRLARSQHPDLIVLDMLLPGLHAFQMLERLRAGPETREIPVLVMADRDLSETAKQTLTGQAVAVLRKGRFGKVDLLAWADFVIRGTPHLGRLAAGEARHG